MLFLVFDCCFLFICLGKNYDNYDVGNYLDLGIVVMIDLIWDWGLNLVLGL